MFLNRNLDRNKYLQTASTPTLRILDPKSNLNYEKNTKDATLQLLNCQKKRRKDTTDLKAFKEKEHIGDNESPLSCFQLISLSQPKLFVSLQELNKIEFPTLSYTTAELINFSKLIIESSTERKRVAKAFNLNKLIELIAQNYNIQSYHNFTHAFSLLLLLFQCYNRSPDLQKLITQKHWFYVFIAALAHDLGHPGTTNSFQVKRKSQIALDAGNTSVLQKLHLSNFWSILKNSSQVNFLQGYSSYQSNYIKQLITRMILATDVVSHFKNLQTLKNVGYTQTFSEQKSIVALQNIFHACDIGNPCLDFKSYTSWAALVSYQFNNVAIMQEKLGLQVTTYLRYDDMEKFYGGQISFCKGLVYPLWKQLSCIFPGLQEFQQNIEKNMLQLQKRKQL